MDSLLIRSPALTPRRRPRDEASASSSNEGDGISVNAVIVDSDTEDQDEKIAEIPDAASNVYEQNTISSSTATGNQEADSDASLSSNKQNPWPYLNKFFECIGLKDQKTIWNINVSSVNHCVKNYHAV